MDVDFESMETLKHGIWLNDQVINHYLMDSLAKRDKVMCGKDAGRRRSHFFSSFFIQNMFDEMNNNSHLRGKYNYDNVRGWGKKVPGGDVFNLKYIVCPVNIGNMHWCCAVIFMEEKRIQYYDSMRGTDKGKMEGILSYLKDEYKKNHDDIFDASGWALVDCSRDIYCQRNGFDCGVFTCMYADFISRDLLPVFQQSHISKCRDRIAASILKYL
ncbi:hypothetical protein ACHAXR_002362 [Thalassiosira sp. AJA248-18]